MAINTLAAATLFMTMLDKVAVQEAHIQRVRNSSLVERSCAENVRG